MIDSHCHLNFDVLRQQLPVLLEQCGDAGIEHIHIPGTKPTEWPTISALCERYPQLSYSLGLHPYFLDDNAEQHLGLLQSWLDRGANKRPVAVGEIGLDAAIEVPLDTQMRLLDAQLGLAQQQGLPVILHHRKTHHLLMQAIKHKGFSNGGIVHNFSGSQQQAKQYLDAGFLLGFGGVITYPRAQKTRSTLSYVPDDGYVLETDAPDMPVCGHQGKPNSPLRLTEIADSVAQIREQDVAVVNQHTSANFRRLFWGDE